jgi:hypothetical protein
MKKLVKESLYEKFAEDSDPVKDISISDNSFYYVLVYAKGTRLNADGFVTKLSPNSYAAKIYTVDLKNILVELMPESTYEDITIELEEAMWVEDIFSNILNKNFYISSAYTKKIISKFIIKLNEVAEKETLDYDAFNDREPSYKGELAIQLKEY